MLVDNIIELESLKDLHKWAEELGDSFTLPHIPYSITAITYSITAINRELSRRLYVNDVLRDQWIEAHKISPCPICGKTWSTKGRGMTYKSAKAHVLKCEGE